MRRSSIVALSLLGVGGTALAASAFTGGNCERAYSTVDQCVAQHGSGNCTPQTRTGPDGNETRLWLGPNRSCSAWNHGGMHFFPGYYGGGYYGGGYGAPAYAPNNTARVPAGTPGSSIGGSSQRGGFGGTGSSFSSSGS